MNYVETKEMTATKIKAEMKAWTTETVMEALTEILGAENVGMVRVGTVNSQKNVIAAKVATVDANGETVPGCVTIEIAAKNYVDAEPTAKGTVRPAFDFDGAIQTYKDYILDKEAKAAEKAEAKAKKIAKDEAARKAKEDAEG